MTPPSNALVARRIPRQEFEAAALCFLDAEAQAKKIIETAEREAQSVLAEADARRRTVSEQIRHAERRLLKVSAQHQLEDRNATAGAVGLKVARDILAEFDRATPWLVELVSACVRKIVGDLAPADVLAVTVARCVQEMKSEHGVVLRCSAYDFEKVNAILQDRPEDFEAVSRLRADPGLSPGMVCLDGQGGFFSIGVEAQLDCLLREISAACGKRTE